MKRDTQDLVVFFVATFVWTWAFYAPMALGHQNPYQVPWMILLILGGMGPSVVGVVLTLLRSDKEQQRDYWRRCFSPRRIGFPWWVVILLFFPLVMGASVALDAALGGPLPGMTQLRSLLANPVMWPLTAFISFLSGPWSEEFGWRGYALERIIKPLGTLRGSAVLGLIWAAWHLPLYGMPGTWHQQMGFKLAGFPTFVALSVGLSLVMTWVFLNTNRSILSGMLLHFGSNFLSQLLAPISDRAELARSFLLMAIGVGVCVLWVRRTSERRRLEA